MISFSRILFLLMLFSMMLPENINAQDKLRPRLAFSYQKVDHTERYLNVKGNVRIDKVLTPVAEVPLKFYYNDMSEDNLLGTAKTDADGTVAFLLPDKFFTLSKGTSEYTFYTVLEDQDKYRDTDSEITVNESEITLELTEEDEKKIVKAQIFRIDTSNSKIPVEGVELRIKVARPFGPLPISDPSDMTNEDGELMTEFPADLPGNEEGMVSIIAALEDSDEFGSVMTSKDIDWGVIPHYDDNTLKRSLWAAGANAPLGLLFFVNSLIISVWGVIFYIVYQIYRISKL